MIAERAQRQRKEAKLAHRRQVYKDSLDQVIEEERQALMRKHGQLATESVTRQGTGLTSHSRVSTGTHTGNMTPAALAAMSNMSLHWHFRIVFILFCGVDVTVLVCFEIVDE